MFLVSKFVDRIKDFDTDYSYRDSYTKDYINTITFDTGKKYEIERVLEKFREIMGLSKEEK